MLLAAVTNILKEAELIIRERDSSRQYQVDVDNLSNKTRRVIDQLDNVMSRCREFKVNSLCYIEAIYAAKMLFRHCSDSTMIKYQL